MDPLAPWMGQALITKQGSLNSINIMTILITAEDKVTQPRLPHDQRRCFPKEVSVCARLGMTPLLLMVEVSATCFCL